MLYYVRAECVVLRHLSAQPDFFALATTVGFENWSPANYTLTWKTFATAVADVIQFKPSKTTFQTGAFAGFNPFIWYPGAVLNAGLMESKVAEVTSTFAEHSYYVSCFHAPRASAFQC